MNQQSVYTTPPRFTIALMGRGMPLPALRRIRHAKLMKQGELAAAAGVNRTTIALIEAQGKAADIATIKKLAEALGVEASDLMAPAE